MEVMVKEYKQIDTWPIEGKPAINPIDPDTLSHEEMKMTLDTV